VQTPTLIYCGGGNSQLYEIATAAGFKYGVRLPDTVYGPLHFADQDFHNPDRGKYMRALSRHQSAVAPVLDWAQEERLAEVLDWAEEAAQFARECILIVPKVIGGIGRLPRRIGGKTVVLGYSVPTRYGGTELPIWEFAGWASASLRWFAAQADGVVALPGKYRRGGKR
jgi:hypothetical protein